VNFVLGFTLFLLGGAVALLSAGKFDAAGIVLGALAVGWSLMGLYLLGIRHGKQTNDL